MGSDVRSYGLTFLGLVPLAWLMALAYGQVNVFVALVFALPLYTTRAAYQSVVELRRMFTQTVRALASAIDARDPSTKRHSEHVSGIAVEIGQAVPLLRFARLVGLFDRSLMCGGDRANPVDVGAQPAIAGHRVR